MQSMSDECTEVVDRMHDTTLYLKKGVFLRKVQELRMLSHHLLEE